MTTIESIIEAAALQFRVPVTSITAPGQRVPIREVRYAVCWVARNRGLKYKDISAGIKRAKSRAQEGTDVCDDLMSVDAVYRRDVLDLLEKVEAMK